MGPVFIKGMLAAIATAGLAFHAAPDDNAYAGTQIDRIEFEDVDEHARLTFARADRDQNGSLDVDEYTALRVVEAELTRLKGFYVIETAEGPRTLAFNQSPEANRNAMGANEQIRVAAVARGEFYQASNADGLVSEEEFVSAQRRLFDVADTNNNGRLQRRELAGYAMRLASFTVGA